MAEKDTELIKQGEQRYISANALEKFVSDVRRRLPKESRDFFTRDEMLLNFQQYVHAQPTIDAVPVVRGEWKTWEEQFPGRTTRKKNNLGVFCSACQLHADNMTRYCPNCGAKMEDKS